MKKINFDFDLIENELRSKLLKGSVIPRPIAWISTLNETGTVNLAPFSYFNVVSPTMMMVSFQSMETSQKDTFVNLIREKEAVVHIVDYSLLEKMDETGKFLARNESELRGLELSLSESKKIKTPAINEALIHFEVILDQAIELKHYDKDEIEADMVILRVISCSVDDSVFDEKREYIKGDNLNPVSRLGGVEYGLTEVLDFERKF